MAPTLVSHDVLCVSLILKLAQGGNLADDESILVEYFSLVTIICLRLGAAQRSRLGPEMLSELFHLATVPVKEYWGAKALDLIRFLLL